MLILARKPGERIMIGDQIELSVIEVRGDQVKLGIKAPKKVKVYRYEVYSAMQSENVAASKASPEHIISLPDLKTITNNDIIFNDQTDQ